jgi:hypothetical protein
MKLKAPEGVGDPCLAGVVITSCAGLSRPSMLPRTRKNCRTSSRATLAEIKHMKPPLPRTLSAVPRTLHVHLEIAKAIRALTSQDEDERLLGKAAADDPNHPGWPAGTSGGKGG